MRIGFSRAARLVDMMEAEGLVSPSAGGKPREVLVDRGTTSMRSMRILASVLVAAPASPARPRRSLGAVRPIPPRLYTEATGAGDGAARRTLSNPAARDAAGTQRRLRTLVGAYDDLARLFPASGLGDKALWQGGMLAADAFWQFGRAGRSRRRRSALLETLRKTLPGSTLTRQSRRTSSASPTCRQPSRRRPRAPAPPPAPSVATAAPAPAPTRCRHAPATPPARRPRRPLRHPLPSRRDCPR